MYLLSKKIVLVVGIVAVALLGCRRSYMNPQHPVQLTSTAFPVAAEGQAMNSYYALVLAFNDRKWSITEVNPEDRSMIARTPRGRTDGQDGIPVYAKVMDDGSVELHHLYGKDLSRGWATWLKRWIARLDASFREYRHRDLAWLKQELRSRGFAGE